MDNYTNAEKERIEEEAFKKTVDELNSDQLPTANIMVAGVTGVGKSTLLNAVFGDELAATGKGRPVTDQIREYQSENLPIHIWDTVGLEIDSAATENSINSIRQTIAAKASVNDPFDRIHAIWYCIASSGNRYQDAELKFIKTLHSLEIPFLIVLTKCYGAEEDVNAFEAQIREINERNGMGDIEVIQVLAKDYTLRGNMAIPAFGLDTLVSTTIGKLSDFVKGGFVAAQRIDKEQKRLLCEDIIYGYVRAAKEGFWDKFLIANIFAANSKIMNMFKKIGKAYNTALSDDSIEKIRKSCHVDFKNMWWGVISPIDMGYGKKVSALLSQKKDEGFKVAYDSFKQSEKVARLVAFYGYIFISSIEELWANSTEEQMKNIEKVADRLIEIINRELTKRRMQVK